MVDIVIFGLFMLVTLFMGLSVSKGINNLRDYAVGSGTFSTFALIATFVATWIGGASLSLNALQTYKYGFFYFFPNLAGVFMLMALGYFCSNKLKKFIGDLSPADSLSKQYGNKVGLVAALTGVLFNICIITLQFKISASVLQIIFNLSNLTAVILSAITVTFYSAMGGIRAVTVTDIFQALLFGVFIPLIIFLMIKNIFGTNNAIDLSSADNRFSLNNLADTNNPHFWYNVGLLFVIPSLSPGCFQRILMAKDEKQIRDTLVTGCLCVIVVIILCCFLGMFIYAENKNLELSSGGVLKYIANNYSLFGLKSLLVIAVMAAIMSSADSYINSSAVLIVNDIFAIHPHNQLIAARISSFIVGAMALIISFQEELIALWRFTLQFYIPIVSIPLYASIFDIKMKEKTVLTGMLCGFLSVLILKNLDITFDLTLPGMFATITGFVIGSFIFGKEGKDEGLNKQTNQKVEEPSTS